MFKYLLMLLNNRGASTTTTTLTEAIPTAVASALLELDEGDVVRPLVTNVAFPGPGVVHQTPFIQRLTSEADDSLTSQALDSTTSDETSPSEATVGVHGSYVLLKEIAALGTVDDMMAVAGKLIGQSVVKRRNLDLNTLFASFTTDQGAGGANPVPGDLFDAYGSLRTYFAPLPYHLVAHPGVVFRTTGIASFFDNSTDALQSFGVGSVGEDWTKYGFSGMVFGFNLWIDASIDATSASAVCGAFSKEAIKYVSKRGFRIDVDWDVDEVGWEIAGTEMWGEAVLRNLHGNAMSFDTAE